MVEFITYRRVHCHGSSYRDRLANRGVTMKEAPEYLVEDETGRISGYWRRDILRCDLALHKSENPGKYENIRIFKRDDGVFTVSYRPISQEEFLREKV